MVLALKNVTRFHGTRLIFKDISMNIPAGAVTLLAGANGAGKSTLLHIMAGLLEPSSGSVRYSTGQSADIGLVGHSTCIYPDLTALENLMFWNRLHKKGLSEDTCEKALAEVELLPFAHEKAGSFSRGMAQRLNLARVFMLRPRLLLLDEPATGLDTRSTRILHDAIANAAASGAAVVWITHSVQADLERAHTVAFLEKKRLAYWGASQGFLDTAPGNGDTPTHALRTGAAPGSGTTAPSEEAPC